MPADPRQRNFWLIPVRIMQHCAFNEARTFIEHRPLEDGEQALFNKNALTYQYFQNCHKIQTHYAWVGEADELQPYFSQVILPYAE